MKNFLGAFAGQRDKSCTISGLRAAAPALLTARTAQESGKTIFCVLPSEQQALVFEQDLQFFTDLPVLFYPGYDIPPYTPLSPDPQTVAGRIATLFQIVNAAGPLIVVTPAEALIRKVMPGDTLGRLAELVMSGEETNPLELSASLVRAGYEPVSLVQNVGEFCLRGGIMDIYPPPFDCDSPAGGDKKSHQTCSGPIRLDFFGDTIESIRQFDPISQRSIQELSEAVLLPASDILFPEETARLAAAFVKEAKQRNWSKNKYDHIAEKLKSGSRFPGMEFFLPLFYPTVAAPLDIMRSDDTLLLIDPLEINRSLELSWERINANYQESLNFDTPALPPEDLFVTLPELTRRFTTGPVISVTDFPVAEPQTPEATESAAATAPIAEFAITTGNHTLLKQNLELERRKRGILAPLADQVGNWLEQGDSVVIGCRSGRHAGNLADIFRQYNLPLQQSKPPWSSLIGPGKNTPGGIVIIEHPLSAGFDLPAEKIHFLSEGELFGEKRLGRKQKISTAKDQESVKFEELKAGEIVVHQDHGLGIYAGLVNMEINNIVNDYVQIDYLGNDKLYVPADRLYLISKYKGLSDKEPKLDKLGSKTWATAKDKVKEAVWKVAQELLELYARREIAEGRQFSPPAELYRDLEESFPFDETPGQIKAINEVIEDLTSSKVTDRLVCGDVGYGKTEVAIRAAFKVVEDGYQVAVLVPTTVLAEQHAETFKERLQGLPLAIRSLNRFRSPSDQKKTLQGLSDGKVDVVIGTHRLLSKDVIFRKLGLLIIDEEHRFGVKDKEKLKKLRAGVDVLTLTATPIPRTLQMSLLGVRDLSVISSPPRHRRSVKTFVARHDELVIKEAITRELQRGGQVFLVHNRVQSIQEMALTVEKLRPEARVAVAHGQMPGKLLEEIMVKFVNRDIDVLVCTTIIESGLDIPNANTIIITRADRLGLAEIYQLRGRVGRSTEQAYAYLLVPSLDGLSKDAKQRLRALMDYNELGGGFKLAMSDLQIRGGGNILGESQSGNIAAVGYDLYLDLLQKTVDDLKQRAGKGENVGIESFEPEINLLISAYIPDRFIPDVDQRYLAYRRISSIDTPEELDDLKDELRDRYGALPGETINLFDIVGLKRYLKTLRIVRLEQGQSTLVFTFKPDTPVDPQTIMKLISSSKDMRLTPDNKFVVNTKLGSPAQILAETKKILHLLGENATN